MLASLGDRLRVVAYSAPKIASTFISVAVYIDVLLGDDQE